MLLQTGVAQADISTTAITSPGDPSYFYDPTGGAYGGIAVTGTTNSTDPSTDQVDIDCYQDNGSTSDTGQYDDGVEPLVQGVSVNSGGGFSATVPYSAIEDLGYNGECRLRAVPAGTTPTTGLGDFAGPRVLLAYLGLDYDFEYGTNLVSYYLNAPQLGADNFFGSWPDCSVEMGLASTAYFGESNEDTFDCTDTFGDYGGDVEVDGNDAYTVEATQDQADGAISVSATQNPSNGDITVHETEPLYICAPGQSGQYGCGEDVDSPPDPFLSSGVEDDRTIEQTNNGHVVLITDSFRSTDGAAHQVIDDIGSNVDLDGGATSDPILFDFPGSSGYQSYTGADSVDVGSAAPATIYAYNSADPDGSTTEGRGAITYFTAPSGPVTFPSDTDPGYDAESPVIPYTINVPAGGSAAISLAYSTEYTQSAFAADLATALDLQTPPTIAITSPAGGSTTTASTVTVTGVATATTGVKSVSVDGVAATLSGPNFSATVPLSLGANTIDATITTDSGVIASATATVTKNGSTGNAIAPQSAYAAILGPLAFTGAAVHAGRRKEKLSGQVTPGSASVSYYFAYGATKGFPHRTKLVQLGAGKSSRAVALTIAGLRQGKTYHYRLVVEGADGDATGLSRSFTSAAAN